MKQVMVGRDGVSVQEVPAPKVQPGTVLVQLAHSCISTGTELSGVQASDKPLFRRVLERPDRLRTAFTMALTQGVGPTVQAIRGRLDAHYPLGYSASGSVIAVGAGVDDVAVGDRVACTGSQCAFHAEIIAVPRNLVTPVPSGVAADQASLVAIGAIALQGVRRAAPTIGETFVVIGLGLIGQLTVQILKANGVRVVGTDVDASRVAFGLAHGLDAGFGPEQEIPDAQVARLTDGAGADGVIITAASPSDGIVAMAFRMCRRKARVVLVGDVGLDIQRADIYGKELDFLVSTSYGPGRYDRRYEEEGLDYPIGFVRWTENRNMAAFLSLIDAGRIDVAELISAHFPVDSASEAYRALLTTPRPYAVVLDYPSRAESVAPTVSLRVRRSAREGALRLAIIGPGEFIRGTLLPIIASSPEHFATRAVIARHGHSAAETARQYGACYASTDADAAFNDAEVDAVLIGTRHDLHGKLVLRALAAGKHVFVEKPLCLTRDELTEIEAFFAKAGDAAPLLLTGFNRRFSKYATPIRQAVARRTNPLMINYRVNAGYVPPESWLHGAEGGGRNIGEACHFYDLFVSFVDARAQTIEARAIHPRSAHYTMTDNFSATIGFVDGSVATLTYTALGSPDFPKEMFEVFVDGRVYSVNDFKRLSIAGAQAPEVTSPRPDKGHREELIAFAEAARHGGAWPIPLWQQVEAMRIAFEIERSIRPAPLGTSTVQQ